MQWMTSRHTVDLTAPKVMGIVNVTPDSFSDGGQHASTQAALQHCERLLKDGADILDIGGESTRPGAMPLSIDDELKRILPVIREAVHFGLPISVDTYKPSVMQTVLDLGVDIINDIWALRWRDASLADATTSAWQVVARHKQCGVCLMHMHREPLTMQAEPMAGDVVLQVQAFLAQSSRQLESIGVDRRRIVLDPGIGFGKTVVQNFALLGRQTELLSLGFPLLAGWSRKSSLASVVGLASQTPSSGGYERMVPSVAAALLSLERGASIVRVHDVRETVQAMKIFQAIK